MQKVLLFCTVLLFSLHLQAQDRQSYDMLQFTIPANWIQQERQDWTIFSGSDSETNIAFTIKICKSKEAAPKIDSSFKQEWQQVLGNNGCAGSIIPIAKKRTSSNSLRYAENGMEMNCGSEKKYNHLFVFAVQARVQTICISTGSLLEYRKLQSQSVIYDFLESLKSKEKQ